MIYTPWSIVEIPFPFTDKSHTKIRPCVVINNTKFAEQQAHYHLLMITGAKHSHWDTDVMITDLAAAGLTKPCVVRFKIFTLSHQLISNKLGALSDIDRVKVQQQLHETLALNS